MTVFEKNIGALNFNFKKKATEGGVLLTRDYLLNSGNLSPQELFALETAVDFQADAVYFRYFNDGRESVPQIYIYDNTDAHLTEKKKKDIHIKVWSGCQVPLFLIVDKTEVNAFDAREKVKADTPNHAFETIKLIGESIRKFSASSFDDGLFWEDESNGRKFQFATSAYRDLIGGLKNVYTDFQTASKLNSHVALKLLVQCLLIKYLEERDEESSHGYFAKTYFKNHFQSNSFCEIIRKGKLLDLLDKLAIDFNGKIFEWDKEEEKKARTDIQRSVVRKLADYLDGNIQNEQYVLWRLYSFSHLPVELISSVYEELLTNNKDIVYTPEMIVSTLVDECMPLKSPKKDFKLIDVSCGSGIFLVKAYKRLIQWWRYEKWLETGKLIKPPLPVLKQLLSNSIYGRDIQGDAIRLSIFSLALALLDEVDLDPPTWQKLKFPDLSENNIVENDFFEFITNQPLNDFDLVIGNPPFNPPKDENGEQPANGAYFKKLKARYGYKSDVKIPDDNLALHFLVQAMQLLKQGAMLCLIQPSGPFMYQKDEEFKKTIFSQYNLLQIVDFTKLADALWGKRNVATAAIFMQKSSPDSENVVHVIANRTFSNLNRLFLELDHYDFHLVDKDAVINNPYVWKSNVIGGGRVVPLISRLSKLRTVGQFLEVMENEGWKAGEGFIASDKGNPCDYITGRDFLPTKSFTEEGINLEEIQECSVEKFHRPRDKKIYTPPHILIKANIGQEKLFTFFSEKYLVFKDKIIGIHAPKKDKEELHKLYSYFEGHSNLLRFYIACTSGQQSVNRATAIIKDDLMILPYPGRLSEIKNSVVEKILIDDVLRYQLNNGENELFKNTTGSQIKAFSEIFCQTLNSIYKDGNVLFRLFKILEAGKYFALHFEYTDIDCKTEWEQTANLEKYIEQVIPADKTKGKSSHTQRVLKVYGKNTIILVKPKNLRYWLRSIALRDADETFADYIKARYY